MEMKCHLSRMELLHHMCDHLFISNGQRKKRVSKNTIFFLLHAVINKTCRTFSDSDCRSVAKAHEVRSIGASMVFENFKVHQGSEAKYVGRTDPVHLFLFKRCHPQVQYMDIFSINSMVATQELV